MNKYPSTFGGSILSLRYQALFVFGAVFRMLPTHIVRRAHANFLKGLPDEQSMRTFWPNYAHTKKIATSTPKLVHNGRVGDAKAGKKTAHSTNNQFLEVQTLRAS